jgi:hypothetical protein
MLMVIFGAGASFDSAQAFRLLARPAAQQNFPISKPDPDQSLPWRPPLADDLFQDRHRVFGEFVNRYPKIRAILPLLRERSEKSVEEVLEFLQGEAKEYPERHRQLASVRFYLRDLLFGCTSHWLEQTNGVTNYESLIDQVQRRHRTQEAICLVTFNYDLLLDSALIDFRFHPKEPQTFLESHPVLKVFKLHGSVNWARGVVYPDTGGPQGTIESAAEIVLAKEWLTVNQNENDREGIPLFPCLAIPVQTKTASAFECPQSHLKQLEVLLPRVSKILIIGWQAKEGHFLQFLNSNLGPLEHLLVVSGNEEEAKKIANMFINYTGPNTRRANRYFSTGGFTDFVVNREGDDFFKL